jgi:hypothetical protein
MSERGGQTSSLPKQFSLNRQSFDHEPVDAQLVALLGPFEFVDPIKIEDTAASLTASAGSIPMKFAVPFMLLFVSGITAARWYFPKFDLPWFIIGIVWFAILPTFFAILVFINRTLTKMGVFFRADKLHRTLTLPSINVTLAAKQIVAFTQVDRWYKGNTAFGLSWIRMTAVLTRREDGGFDYFPLTRETSRRVFQELLVDRLGQIFNVPVRKIVLTRLESKSLQDHN